MSDTEKKFKLLIINPGSTSTKVSLFENETSLFEKSLFHDADILLSFPHVNDQMPFRYGVILDMLKDEGYAPEEIDVFVGRGGSAHTQPGGITKIDQQLYDDTVAAVGGSEHPAKLGVMLAWKFAQEFHKPAFTLNPTNVDEYGDYARLTGIKGIYRVSHSHVLNQKAVAEYHAEKVMAKLAERAMEDLENEDEVGLGRLLDAPGGVLVLPGGTYVPRGVVVGEGDEAGLVDQGRLQDGAGIRQHLRQGAGGDHALVYKFVFLVEASGVDADADRDTALLAQLRDLPDLVFVFDIAGIETDLVRT